MDERLRELSEGRYAQQEFLKALFDLALDEQWFELQHCIQHDMAKAILADYSYELGLGYLNQDIFYKNWEDVIGDWLADLLHPYRIDERESESLSGSTERSNLA